MSRKLELLKLAMICRKQAAISSTPAIVKSLLELGRQYEEQAEGL